MRTSTDGLTYTYTCIQGAQGATGNTGATGATGEKGETGDSTYVYNLLCSPSAVVKESVTDTPPSITFMSKRAQGTGIFSDYPARFVIATSEDGSL